MNTIIKIIPVFLLVAGFAATADAQQSRREKRAAADGIKMEEINKLIESRNFCFIAKNALPMGGGSIFLTSRYSLDVRNDTVTAWLPYYGESYRAEFGTGEGGIKFTDKPVKSEWNITDKKYEVVLSVKIPSDEYHLQLTVTRLGYATLNVQSNNRQSISFTGNIVPPEPPE